MDFELPEELLLFKEALRRFVDAEMTPVERDATTDDENSSRNTTNAFASVPRTSASGRWTDRKNTAAPVFPC